MHARSLHVPLCVDRSVESHLRRQYQTLLQGTKYTETGRFADFSAIDSACDALQTTLECV